MKKFTIGTNRKLIIILNLFLILTLMTVSVYSWFAAHVNNQVDAYEITVESDNAIELSFDNNEWSTALNLANLKTGDGKENVFDKLRLVEVTGDGETFRTPSLTQRTNYAEVNVNGTWSVAQKNSDYLKFKVYMRSKEPLYVYLSSASTAAPISNNLTGENCDNPSSYAMGASSFSKDTIVGALRVSYENSIGNRYIWITNPNYHLNNLVGSSDYSMTVDADNSSFSTGSGEEGSAFSWNNPYIHYYYNNNNVLTQFASDNTLTSLPGISDDNSGAVLVSTLTKDSDSDKYYTGSVEFTVWIEGCDTEARRALVDGKFNLTLIFDSVDIKP